MKRILRIFQFIISLCLRDSVFQSNHVGTWRATLKIICIIISMSALPSGLFPFADAKIEPFFQTSILSHEGKNPKWNERNEKVIFTGKNGIIFFSIPSSVR